MSNVSILICSHGKANDLWPITAYFFNKYWPDCPYNIYLGANGNRHATTPERWKYINTGKDISWSQSLHSYLENIPTEHVILMLDDFMLTEKVSSENLIQVLQAAININAVMLRLKPNPGPDQPETSDFGKIDVINNVPYITSLQMALWNKSFLQQLLAYGFNPWEFETKAGKTVEAKKHASRFFCTYSPLISYQHYIEKGMFFPFIKTCLEDENITFDLSQRPFYPVDRLRTFHRIDRLKSWLRRLIPQRHTNTVRRFFGLQEL